MRPRVIAQFMSLGHDSPRQVRLGHYFFADHEERASDAQAGTFIEQPGRVLRIGAIIKSQGDCWASRIFCAATANDQAARRQTGAENFSSKLPNRAHWQSQDSRSTYLRIPAREVLYSALRADLPEAPGYEQTHWPNLTNLIAGAPEVDIHRLRGR